MPQSFRLLRTSSSLTQAECERVSDGLVALGVTAAFYHAQAGARESRPAFLRRPNTAPSPLPSAAAATLLRRPTATHLSPALPHS